MNWYLKVLRQYADFSGRARRKEYWMFVLFNMLIIYGGIFVLGIIVSIISSTSAATGSYGITIIFTLFLLLYLLATFIPSLAVVVRRLHDTDNSGWMLFISFIPLIGGIWLLVLMCTDGTAGDNRYGPDPKDRTGRAFNQDRFTMYSTTQPQANVKLSFPALRNLADELAHFHTFSMDESEADAMEDKLLKNGSEALQVIMDYLLFCSSGRQRDYWWNNAKRLVRLIRRFPGVNHEALLYRLINQQSNIWEYQTQVKDIAQSELDKIKMYGV